MARTRIWSAAALAAVFATSTAHAEVRIGDSVVMLADASESTQGGPMPGMIHLYVEDVDTSFKRALGAGAKEQRPVQDQFWGDRMGTLIDPFGHQWSLATHVEDVPESEMEARMKEFGSKQKEAEPA